MQGQESKTYQFKMIVLLGIAVILVAVVMVFTLVRKAYKPEVEAPKGIANVIKDRVTWDTAFNEFWGQTATDFTFKDVNDKTHKLSDFRGRPVLIVFWATWCPPCREEIPGLINLRKMYDSNSLAIIGISNEDAKTVKEFAAEKGLNYTVAGIADAVLPEPFGLVNGIPAGFFVDSNGVIKLATEGLVHESEIKNIIKAIKQQ